MSVAREAAGKWVRVQFWDHVMGHDKPILCEVAGRVSKVSARSLTIDWWVTHDDCKETSAANNEKVGTILQSTVVKWMYAGGIWR